MFIGTPNRPELIAGIAIDLARNISFAYTKQFRNVAFNSSRHCLRSGISLAFGPTVCITYFIGLGKFLAEVWVT